jgi:MFS family permease
MNALLRFIRENPSLARLLGARTLSMGAFQMQAVAVGWQMYALTGSAFDLGLVGLAQFVPMLLLTLVSGHVSDMYDRRRIIATCETIECVCMFVLGVGSLMGWLTPPIILAIMAVMGGTRVFETPTLQALLPSLVTPEMLGSGIAWSASAYQTATMVGPALGGLLYAVGVPVPFFLASLSFGGAALLIRTAQPLRPPTPRNAPDLRSAFSGLVFIWRQKVILGSISLDLFAVLLGGATALLPIYARDILGTGSWGLGVLRAAPAVGAVVMSLVLGRFKLERSVGKIMFASVVAYGLGTIVFGLSRSLPLSLLALMLLGASDVISVVIRNLLVQTRTPEAMLGRVTAVSALFTGTSNQLGEFESGVTAAMLGAVGSVMLGGIGTIVIAGLWMLAFPALRDADRPGSETA